MTNYLYDSTSGFYYDPETTLYYDPNSRVRTQDNTDQCSLWPMTGGTIRKNSVGDVLSGWPRGLTKY